MDHRSLRELAAGAALDDLDPAERIELDRHLLTCAPCAALAGDLDDVLAELVLVAPELHPPASLRGDVLQALRGPAALGLAGATVGASGSVPTPLRRSGPSSDARVDLGPGRWRTAALTGTGIAAVLAVAVAGLGARAADLTGQMAAARAAIAEARALAGAQDAALTLIATPDHVTAGLEAEPVAPGASAMVVYLPGSVESYLMATGLPATPTGQVYQLWYADANGVHALGTFHHDGQGAFVAPFGIDLGDSAAAMVTLESEGGAQGEPGPQVVFGEL